MGLVVVQAQHGRQGDPAWSDADQTKDLRGLASVALHSSASTFAHHRMMNDPREYNVSISRERQAIFPSALLDWHSLTLLICAALLTLMVVYRHSTPHLALSIACLLIWPLIIFYVMRNDDFSV